MSKWASVNVLDVKFQVHLGAEKVQRGNNQREAETLREPPGEQLAQTLSVQAQRDHTLDQCRDWQWSELCAESEW